MTLQVLFICGSLEPAKSGVADYILMLASRLSSKGILCACMAIHDPFVRPSNQYAVHRCIERGIDTIRMSAHHPWHLKSKLIKSQLAALRPEWISLHYVPYAYNSKGLPFEFLSCMNSLRNLSSWEITAHELWVDPGSSFRNKLLSKLQRFILLRLASILKPPVVHVTNHCYQAQLSHYHIQSSVLPLFSSIPLSSVIEPLNSVQSRWTFVVFGAINRDWNPDLLLEQIDEARRHHNIQSCHFVSVGNIGDYGADLWESLKSSRYPAFEFFRLGLLSTELISEQLRRADFGIAVVPSLLIGKSSAVAAMLAHGLPVIISRLSPGCDQWHQELQRTGKYILLDSSFVKSLVAARKYQPVNQLDDTTSLFVEALQL